ncbi:hypothetical protein QYM36_000672 [Artemia franciscana]|uniref:CRAL-TRIO domain-containing protein n=1 Tax=Artemia franciscana TaxID=6661 RepID=A0AA88IM38_ARTSF|nr:hypothetical protein QYM36_000672 [Artemia franciscana]KAK2726301.1 hypothetical protein QYM36_000672 [Artemia franciscana]KAK2726302.1 hypothetical protein QYM36_000672 [Artemia franciscana]
MPCSPEFSVESCYTSPTTESQKEKKDCHGCSSIKQESDNALEDFRMAVKEQELDYITTDEFLLTFLNCRKWDKNRALKLLRNYWEMRKVHSHLFDFDITSPWPALQQELTTLVRMKDGSYLFLFRVGPWNPKVCSVDEIHHLNITLLRIAATCKATVEKGLTVIVDFKNFGIYQARHFTPCHAKLIVSILQDNFPMRFRGIHIINMPYVFSLLMSLVWPLLTVKMKERVSLFLFKFYCV